MNYIYIYKDTLMTNLEDMIYKCLTEDFEYKDSSCSSKILNISLFKDGLYREDLGKIDINEIMDAISTAIYLTKQKR